MENLLQSLYVENRAGFFFTKFCEGSGNEVENDDLKSGFIILLDLKISGIEMTWCAYKYV